MLRRLSLFACVVPVGVFLAVYLANAGHGFLLDDFDWVLNSRVRNLADAARLFGAPSGFFRPAVALTFTVDEWLFGLRPYAYAITNIGLALACAAAIAWLARAFDLSRGASALAGLAWLMNMHFTRTSIMWISGRTALIVTLAAVLSAAWLMRGRLVAAVVALVVALLAKEEAVLLPIVLLLWLGLTERESRSPVPATRWLLASVGALGFYFIARSLTPAMTPANAPDYYRFTFVPAAVWRNVTEYAVRTSSVAVGILLIAALILGWTRPLLDGRTRLAARCGAIWLAGTLGFAYVLPVRSDLYAAVPGVGACLAVAAAVERLWLGSTPAQRRLALIAAVVLPLAVAPIYWQRTQRMARAAAFSTAVLEDLVRLTADLPAHARVWIDDASSGPGEHVATMAASFGAQLASAYELRAGRRLELTLTSELPAAERDAGAAGVDRRLAVEYGHLRESRTSK